MSKFIFSNIRWDVILLDYSEYGPCIPRTEAAGPPIYIKTNMSNIYKFYWSHSTAGYVLNKTIYDDLLKIYRMSIDRLEPQIISL